jgi:tRNA threonylcarbamoyladenosine biosynthesis protein TsaB
MWTLAINTSTITASVALLRNSEIVIEVFVNLGINHSAVLLPIVGKLCSTSGAGVKLEEMDLFVCTVGPGSFTGIRIGVSTVKGFALATGKPVVGVSTLEALAMNLSGLSVMVCPMLDAKKNQVYTALYRTNGDNRLERIKGEGTTEIERFLETINEDVIFIGEGAEKYAGIIRERLPRSSYFATGIQNHIRASMAGLLGENKFHSGEKHDPISLMPNYLRLSEAEFRMQ